MGKVSKIVGSMFGGKPDDSALKAQEARVAEQEKELAEQETNQNRKEQARLNARSRRGANNNSLLSGLETGVAPADAKRGNLG